MPELLLAKGDVVSIKVINIVRTSKPPFPKSDGNKYHQFHITVEDKKGATCICEWLGLSDDQDAFVLNVWQWIEVRYTSPKGTPEIYPTEEPRKEKDRVQGERPGATPGNTSHVDIPLGDKKNEANCYSVPAHGKAITFAMGYAKDILVAEIAANPRKVTSEDIDRMTGWADQINQKICDRIQF